MKKTAYNQIIAAVESRNHILSKKVTPDIIRMRTKRHGCSSAIDVAFLPAGFEYPMVGWWENMPFYFHYLEQAKTLQREGIQGVYLAIPMKDSTAFYLLNGNYQTKKNAKGQKIFYVNMDDAHIIDK